MDVEKKVGYARTDGLGGVFFWEIGQDSFRSDAVGIGANGGILLRAAAAASVVTAGPDDGGSSSVHLDGREL